MIHGQQERGFAVIDTGVVMANNWDAISKEAAAYSHRVVVTSRMFKADGWKTIRVDSDMPPEEMERTARAHSPHCKELIIRGPTGKQSLQVQPPIACNWAPVRGQVVSNPWEGSLKRKPWEYDVELHIPVIDTPDTLPVIIELLRLQTVRPYIVLVDTGSTPENFAKIEALDAPDIEIHRLRCKGMRHTSDLPALSLDMAFSMCRTPKLAVMHSDVFLRSQTALEEMLGLCTEQTPAVGYRMTKREFPEWSRSITHTFAAFHIGRMDDIRAAWSLRKACRMHEIQHEQHTRLGSSLDTETAFSMILHKEGIEPVFLGDEVNWEVTIDHRLRHVRTLPGARLYASPDYKAKSEARLAEALTEARQNIKDWSIE